MIPKLIGICGKKGHGKNTVATMIIDSMLDNEQRLYDEKSFAEPIKLMVSALTNCPLESLSTQEGKEALSPIRRNDVGDHFTYRELLQLYGTDLGRNYFGPDIWVDALFSGWDGTENWIITDVRFPNEVEAIQARGGIVIRVIRPDMPNEDTHESETALDYRYPTLAHILNDTSIGGLRMEVERFLDDLADCYAAEANMISETII